MTTTGSWRDTAITDSNLPPRAIRALTAAGFSDLGSLDDATDIELIRTRDLGRMQMANVRKVIETHRRRRSKIPTMQLATKVTSQASCQWRTV